MLGNIAFDMMILLKLGVMVLIGSLLVFGCSAAKAADCHSQNLTTLELNECAGQDAKRADAELNAVYNALRTKIDSADQQRLRDAQRAWIAFRDKECVFRTGGGADQQGTIWPMLVLKCSTDLTNARVRDLRAQVQCQSWDLSCPAK